MPWPAHFGVVRQLPDGFHTRLGCNTCYERWIWLQCFFVTWLKMLKECKIRYKIHKYELECGCSSLSRWSDSTWAIIISLYETDKYNEKKGKERNFVPLNWTWSFLL
jgi:hypothetical protein